MTKRALRLTLLSPPALALGCLATAACFTASSGGGSPGTNFDSGMADDFGNPTDSAEPPEDNTLPEASPEAAGLDAMNVPEEGPDTSRPTDAGIDVVEAGVPVTVTVIAAAGYEAGVQVVFQDPSGNVLGMPVTTSNGTASLVVPAGSSVTVVLDPATSPLLYTVLGLQPGQQVPVQDWGSFAPPTLNVAAIPSSPALAGVTQYVWSLGESTSFGLTAPSPTSPWSATPGSSPPAGFSLGAFGANVGAISSSVVQAEDQFGDVLGFAFDKGVLLESPDAGAQDLALGSTWSTATTTQNVTVSSPDAGAFGGGNGTYYSEIADGLLMPLTTTSSPTTHPGFADFTQAEVEFGNQDWGIAVSTTTPPAASGSPNVDATGLATAPAFTNAGVTMTGNQPTLSLTLAQGTLAGITGLVAITPFTVVLGDGGQVSGTWTLVAPGTSQTSIVAPAVPVLSSSMAGSFGTPTVYAVTGQTAVTSYGDLLKMGTGFWPLSGCVNGPFVPPLPTVGTVLVSVYSSGLGC